MSATKEMVLGFYFQQAVPTAKDVRVWLIKKSKPVWQRGLFNGIGGKIEPGETPYQAIRREFEEEAGLTVKDIRSEWLLTAVIEHRTGDWKVCVFRAFGAKPPPIKFRTAVGDNEFVKGFDIGGFPRWGDGRFVMNLTWLIDLCLANVMFPISIIQMDDIPTQIGLR